MPTESHVPAWRAAGMAFILIVTLAVPALAARGISKIVFFADHGTGTTEVYTVNPDGSDRVRLTNDAYDEYLPMLSPEGLRVAYESPRPSNAQIYVLDLYSGVETRITSIGGYEPGWSPDGKKIAFTRPYGSTLHLWVVNANGTACRRLTTNSANERHTDWSPDGAKIACTIRWNGAYQVFVMNSDGSGQTQLTTSEGDKIFPNWSPDGKKIVYDPYNAATYRYNIHVMNADGTGDTALTDPSLGAWCASYSPDGTQIAFCSDVTGSDEVYVMNADGSNIQRVTWDGSPGGNSNPRWGILGVRPEPFSLISPAAGDSVPAGTLQFQWHAARDTLGNPVAYDVILSETPDFQKVMFSWTDVPDTTLTSDIHEVAGSGVQLYWKVVAHDAYGVSRTSTEAASPFRTRVTPVAGAGEPGKSGFRVGPAAPNPTAGACALSFSLPAAQQVSVRVLDATGRVVRSWCAGTLGAGAHDLRWDGRADDGTPAASGLYFCRLECPAGRAVRKLVRTR